MHFVLVLGLVSLGAPRMLAQAPAGSLRGQVTDPSGAVVVGANVTAKGADGKSISVKTDRSGDYEFKGLPPGAYTIEVTARGFTTFNGDANVVAGQTQRVDAPLQLGVQAQQVIVEGQRGERATIDIDNNNNAGGVVIQGKDLEALSDDPDDLQAELQELAGPSAGPNGGQIYIDGFTGGQLPPKSMIREIRINQNPFSADKDKVGFGRIEVFTKPGTGEIHGQLYFNNNDSFLNTKNAFIGTIPDYQSNLFNGSIGGPITKKSSFFFSADQRNINEASAISAIVLDSSFNPTPINQALSNPRILTTLSPRIDYQLSENNTFTGRYQFTGTHEKNDGIAQLDLATEAINLDRTIHDLQLSDTQVISPRIVNEIKLEYRRTTDTQKVLDFAPEVDVVGAFAGGGNAGGDNTTTINYYEIQNQTSISRGNHLWKFGGRVRNERDASLTTQNFNGTFIFESINTYRITQLGLSQGLTPAQIRAAGGGASQFSIVEGQPSASANFVDVGLYLQDDWRVRSNLVIGYGLRYETQNEIHDHNDFAPRATVAWGIGGGKNGTPKTVLRAGFGIFYDRFPPSLVLTSEHQNGVNQRQFFVQSPDFFPNLPSPADLSNSITSVWQLGPKLRAPYFVQTGITVERQVSKNSTLSVIYLNSRGFHQFLSRNINTPLPGTFNPDDPTSGVRPLGNVSNVYEFESEGITKQHQLITNVTMRGNSRFSLFSNYTLNFADSNTSSAQNFPVHEFDIKQDYGRASFDIRHRVFAGGSLSLPYAFRITPFMSAESGRPFNITIGQDLNGDSRFNDRPAFATDLSRPSVVFTRFGAFDTDPLPGQKIIPPHYGTASPQFTLNLRVSKTFGFGTAREGGSKSSNSGAAGGGLLDQVSPGEWVPQPYRLTLSVSARNVFNFINLGLPVGDLSSPIFGQPTGIAGPPFSSSVANRRIDLRAQFAF
jgi:hypothetical protein